MLPVRKTYISQWNCFASKASISSEFLNLLFRKKRLHQSLAANPFERCLDLWGRNTFSNFRGSDSNDALSLCNIPILILRSKTKSFRIKLDGNILKIKTQGFFHKKG